MFCGPGLVDPPDATNIVLALLELRVPPLVTLLSVKNRSLKSCPALFWLASKLVRVMVRLSVPVTKLADALTGSPTVSVAPAGVEKLKEAAKAVPVDAHRRETNQVF